MPLNIVFLRPQNCTAVKGKFLSKISPEFRSGGLWA